MTDITSVKKKIQIESSDANSANSEGLTSTVGGTANYLIDETDSINILKGDKLTKIQHDLLTIKTYSWTAPVGVVQIEIELFSGGGGGLSTGTPPFGGGGPGGHFFSKVRVVPGNSYDFIIGNRGVGDASGSASSMVGYFSVSGGQVGQAGANGAQGTVTLTSRQTTDIVQSSTMPITGTDGADHGGGNKGGSGGPRGNGTAGGPTSGGGGGAWNDGINEIGGYGYGILRYELPSTSTDNIPA